MLGKLLNNHPCCPRTPHDYRKYDHEFNKFQVVESDFISTIITSSHGGGDMARLTLLTPNVFLIPPTPANVLIFFHRLSRFEH